MPKHYRLMGNGRPIVPFFTPKTCRNRFRFHKNESAKRRHRRREVFARRFFEDFRSQCNSIGLVIATDRTNDGKVRWEIRDRKGTFVANWIPENSFCNARGHKAIFKVYDPSGFFSLIEKLLSGTLTY